MIVTNSTCADDVQPWILQLQKQLQQLKQSAVFKEGAVWATQKVSDSQAIQKKSSFVIQDIKYQNTATFFGNTPKQGYTNCQPLIFISFSMPKYSIEQWLSQAKRYHGSVILRGLIQNSFKETALQLKEILRLSHYGIQLNPILFKDFQIDSVPAVVLAIGNQFDKVSGDVSLENALEAIADRGTVCQQAAKNLLKKAQQVQP